MPVKILSVFVLMAIVITSCQKESSTEPPSNGGNGNNPLPNDSTLLWKYIEIDTTLPSGSDTSYKIIFSYDDKNRLNLYYSTDYVDDQNVEFFYSGNDSLPYKAVGVWTSYGRVYHDTTFFIYLNGLVFQDSIIDYDHTTNQFIQAQTRTFTQASSNTFFNYKYYDTKGSTVPWKEGSSLVVKTYQDGNIISQEDTATSDVFSYAAHEEVKYDSKINPIYKAIPVHYPMLYYWLIAQKNNPVEEISWYDPLDPEHLTYAYSYRQDGYPLTVKVTNMVSPEGWKGIYIYTK